MASPERDVELEAAIADFDAIQTELNYRQAQDVLREVVQSLDLSPRERAGLEHEIEGLEAMLKKLDQMVVQIVAFGMVGRGKSSVLNALLRQDVFETGPTHGVTQTVQSAQWKVSQEALQGSDRAILRVALQGTGNSQIELIDTPGIDEVGGEAREQLARQLARQADLILFVVSGDITQVEYEALLQLRQANKPMLLVFNKIDQYPTADRMEIYETLRDRRLRELLTPDEIVMAAASPLETRAVRQPDGTLKARRGRGVPQVNDLKLKILDVLQREGKALVALNTMLYADETNEKLIQRKLEIRDRTADDIIWSGTMTKAIAVALNPVTVIDVLTGVVIDVALIGLLSRLYGIPMSQQGAIALLKTIAIGMGGISASELIATLGLSSLKSLLGAAIPVTGGLSLAPYVPVALTQAGVAGVSSHIIGKATKTYLSNGATWGSGGPKAVVQQILDSLDEDSILRRIKAELEAKINKPAS